MKIRPHFLQRIYPFPVVFITEPSVSHQAISNRDLPMICGFFIAAQTSAFHLVVLVSFSLIIKTILNLLPLAVFIVSDVDCRRSKIPSFEPVKSDSIFSRSSLLMPSPHAVLSSMP
jgi:hypothetical protein